MFTIKLVRNPVKTSEEGEYSVSVSCARYDVDQRPGHAFVIAHKEHASDTGTEFHVMNRSRPMPVEEFEHVASRAFDVAFITNEAGKTIDRVGPFESA